ncbi:MAG: peptidogalycan biosysnthesis protein, partial [Gammaproteobacteria bacterium]
MKVDSQSEEQGVSEATSPNDKGEHVLLTTNAGINQIDRDAWNRMVPEDDPGLRHEFLLALESSGSCSRETGWLPCHITAKIDDLLVGAVPAYLKSHSYGEFVFDWAWASAYERAGLAYYPKLLIASPFTPVSGQRILCRPDVDGVEIRKQIASALPIIAKKLNASSVHCIFCQPSDLEALNAS